MIIIDGEGKRREASAKEQADLLSAQAAAVRQLTSADVNEERDRRIWAGFSFAGKTYAFDPASKQRVTGAGTLAGFAIANGAQSGDLFWHGGSNPFRWIADDNSLTEMDAQMCFAFAQAAASHEEAHIFAARAIKDTSPIPADYATNDSYWPAG